MINLREILLGRSRDAIIGMLNILSQDVHCDIISNADFTVGAWTPLNVDHANPILKYIAQASLKEPQQGKACFIDTFSHEVLSELETAFESWYYENPTKAHDTSIQYEVEATRLKTFIEVFKIMDTPESLEDAEVLSKWLNINPVQVAVEDWG